MTTAAKKQITLEDLMPAHEYEKIRKDHKQKLIPVKKNRRLQVGPYATFYFENYDTMWAQIHEMLYIEKGGKEQARDELEAYNPLIPNGAELVATFMIEIDDPVRRDFILRQLGHIEEKIYLSVGGEKIYAVPEQEVERTTEDGKTSAIHFLHFPLNSGQITAFRDVDNDIMLCIEHSQYGHMAVISGETRLSLAQDLDNCSP
ncbi:MAG: hypothetical protein COB93_00940 [Sneathiella sp.]|nr:MAG: hypothetical protein COB93_00940 [Sneathiella sp.]